MRRSDGGSGKIRPLTRRVEFAEELAIVADNKHLGSGEVKAGPSIGRRICELREAAGISLRELSRRSGVSVGYLSRLERDLQVPTTGLLEPIAEALDLELVDLVIDPGSDLRHRVIAATANRSTAELDQLAELLDRMDRPKPTAARIFPEPPSQKTKKGRTSRVRRKRSKKSKSESA